MWALGFRRLAAGGAGRGIAAKQTGAWRKARRVRLNNYGIMTSRASNNIAKRAAVVKGDCRG